MIDDRPPITPDDVKAALWLIAFAVIMLALTAVDPTAAGR